MSDSNGKRFLSPKAYDKAKWHYGGDFPRFTPQNRAFAHIGFFLTWVVDQGLISSFMRSEACSLVDATHERKISPIALLEHWDGVLVSDMLNDEGNAFASTYYEDGEQGYLPDYMAEFSDFKPYKVKPNWKNYDRIKPVIDRRYKEWLDGRD